MIIDTRIMIRIKFGAESALQRNPGFPWWRRRPPGPWHAAASPPIGVTPVLAREGGVATFRAIED
eukprot:COSAG01_NODE_3773_length_5710_cov_473.235965_7_plen_65_part_00